MPRFYQTLLILMIFFASVLIVMRTIGGMRPTELATVFTNPDGSVCQRPCLFGIRPGQTTVKEAVVLLKSHPFMRNHPVQSEDPFLAGDLQNGPTILLSKTPEGLVDRIRLAYNLPRKKTAAVDAPELFLAGGIVNTIGSPDFVCSDDPAFMCYYYADDRTVLIVRTALSANRERVETSDQVQTLTVFFEHQCPPGTSTFKARPWLGFTTALRYNQATNLMIDGDQSNPIPCKKLLP